MHLQQVIERLGYRPNEVRVYLVALRLGECTYSDIAAHTKLPRTSVQLVVDRLHKHGLMNFYVKRRYKYWIAEDPEKLLTELHEREAVLRAVMPALSAMRYNDGVGQRPTIRIFVGTEQIKQIHEDILASHHYFCGFIPWDDWVAVMGREYIAEYVERRVQHCIKGRMLVPQTPSAMRLKAREAKEWCQVRFLPDSFTLTDVILVYANKVAIVCLNTLQPTAVLIDDQGFKNTMTSFFHRFWNLDG